MDVSQPNNWPRIEELCQLKGWGLDTLGKGKVSDEQGAESVRDLKLKATCEPHGAIAYRLLEEQLQENETGLFLCTAHPAKFKEVVDDILGTRHWTSRPGWLSTRWWSCYLKIQVVPDFVLESGTSPSSTSLIR